MEVVKEYSEIWYFLCRVDRTNSGTEISSIFRITLIRMNAFRSNHSVSIAFIGLVR
ncbi:unnamed protein product, partial [Nesidiocoris tenuis]